jgi:mitotic spindle assembly checkpoint protein MAD1
MSNALDTRRQLEQALAAAAAGTATADAPHQAQDDPASAKKRPRIETTPFLPAHNDNTSTTPQQDLFEYLAQRAEGRKTLEARAKTLATKNASLTRNLERTELEASRLRSDLATANAKFEALESRFEAYKGRADAALQREVKRAAELEVQLNRTRADKGSASPLLQPPAAAKQVDIAEEDQDLQKSKTHLLLQLEEAAMQVTMVKAESEDTIRALKAQLETSQRWRESDAQKISLLENQLAAAQSETSREAEARRQAEEQLNEASLVLQSNTPKNANIHGDRTEEDKDVLIKVLQERLTAVEAEAREAANLKRRMSTLNSLQERLIAAESRARRAEAMLDAEQEVHLELESVKSRLEAWTSLFAAVCVSIDGTENIEEQQTPENLLHLLSRLQDAVIKSKEESGTLKERLAEVNSQVQAARMGETLALNERKVAMERAEAAEAAYARAVRRAELAEQELEGFKAIVASYEEEETKTIKASMNPMAETNNLPKTRTLQIETLENTVQGLRQHLETCQKDLAASIEAQQAVQQEVCSAEERAARAEAEWKRVESEALELARQVQVLETRVARGEYNPETTRVLHLKSNPEAELSRARMEASLARLQAENETLKQMLSRDRKGETKREGVEGDQSLQQVAAAEEDTDSFDNAGALKIARLEGELTLLGRKLAEVQKTSDRLQQVFTRQISIFRDAIKGLFGYSVEMTSDPYSVRDVKACFVLRPMYGEAGWELAFRMLKDGRIVMDPTDYSRRHLVREIETFVNRFRSIPALTANITMETFQRQTNLQE